MSTDAALIVALRNRAPAMLAAIRAAYTLAEELMSDPRPQFGPSAGGHAERVLGARLRAVLDEALGVEK